ncbi:MAG: transposase [Gammaproteobacteria bacterium]
MNAHFHYHCCVLDGVFALDAAGTVRFHEATELSQARIDAVQVKVRRRVLKAFVRRGWLEPDEAEEMLDWEHNGGFSIDGVWRQLT